METEVSSRDSKEKNQIVLSAGIRYKRLMICSETTACIIYCGKVIGIRE